MESLNLLQQVDVSGHPHVLMRSGLSVNFYLDASDLTQTCDAVAHAIERYFTLVPRTAMQSYLASNGYFKDIAPRVITKDLNSLRKLPKGFEGYNLVYSSEPFGQAGEHGVSLKVIAPTPAVPARASLLRFEFAENVAVTLGEETLLDFIATLFDGLPADSADAGLAFKRGAAMERESMKFVAPLISRYLAVDPSEHLFTRQLLGSTYSVRWLNLFGADLMAALPDLARLSAIDQRAVRTLKSGCMVRTSRWPGQGDQHAGATDIGLMPSVARAMRPRRLQSCRFAYTDFDAMAWLARFDTMQDRVWE